MKKRCFLNTISIFSFIILHAQIDSTEMRSIRYANNLSTNIKSSKEYIVVLNELLSHPEYFKYKNYMDMLAWWYSYVGITGKAVEIEDKIFPQKRYEMAFLAADYSVKEAVKTIVERAYTQQVIMVNEEHRMPRHRVLTLQLLKPLFEKGYRYLALETLTNDSALFKTGYPHLRSGTYSKDPVFAEMIRTAIKIGYTPVPYDLQKTPEEYKMMNSMQRQMFREESQAKNIINMILKNDPKAKIIVHGGRDHIAEVYEMQSMGADSFRIGMMAGAFKYFSGIDPFTVDQMHHAEHSDTAFESAVFKWVRTQKSIGKLNIFINKRTDGVLTDKRQLYDVAIVPSVTKYLNGRPDWLVEMPDRKRISVDVSRYRPEGSAYFLVQAIYENEDEELAIPADQYAYQKARKNVLLLLKKGSYFIRVLDSKGNVLKKWLQEIK